MMKQVRYMVVNWRNNFKLKLPAGTSREEAEKLYGERGEIVKYFVVIRRAS